MMLFFKTIFIGSTFLLSACSVSKESFDCPAGKGVGCRSISQVNEMVNSGTLNPTKKDTQKPAKDPKDMSSAFLSADDFSTEGMIIERVKEAHLRVWVAPFQDEQGQFHEASVIHTVLRPGFWQVQEGF